MLAALLNPFGDGRSVDRWGWDNKDSHDRIRAALRARGLALTDYQIYPFDPSDRGWLERHSQLHQDMNAALGLKSSDLQDVDFSDDRIKRSWIMLQYQEHYDAERKLGL